MTEQNVIIRLVAAKDRKKRKKCLECRSSLLKKIQSLIITQALE